ncbi:MAG TPA: hypothetical protein VFG33_02610 [Kribbella sp.]|uniref:hypothetical protein n=1 Tax=Kribbella sp. TaxID=1871183 RepID=UPI002D77FA23|nr:hypothetical protein [Kribbella sp.]HET6292230.1 hypothetical protein [Kribbella sp.]
MGHDQRDWFAETFDAALLDQTLRQAGVHPDDVVTLLRYAPLALTHLTWRNSVIEDWHAGPDSRISDGDMFRTNVATTRVYAENLWPIFAEGLAAAELLERHDLDEYGAESLEEAFGFAYDEVFDPARVLPNGMTLIDLGGDELEALREHGARQLDALLDQADEKGVHVVVSWLAMRAVGTCRQWWLSPRWPDVVDAFFERLDNRDDAFWASDRYPRTLPSQFGDRKAVRRLLLTAPDEMAAELAEFCVMDGGLGFVRIDPAP